MTAYLIGHILDLYAINKVAVYGLCPRFDRITDRIDIVWNQFGEDVLIIVQACIIIPYHRHVCRAQHNIVDCFIGFVANHHQSIAQQSTDRKHADKSQNSQHFQYGSTCLCKRAGRIHSRARSALLRVRHLFCPLNSPRRFFRTNNLTIHFFIVHFISFVLSTNRR